MGGCALTSRPIIEIEDLRVVYPDGRVAVDGVSLRIESGSSVALLESKVDPLCDRMSQPGAEDSPEGLFPAVAILPLS